MSQNNPNTGQNQSAPGGILSILSLFALIFAPFIWIYQGVTKVLADGRNAARGGTWSFSKWIVWFAVDNLMYVLSLGFLFFVPLPCFGPLSRAYTGGYSRGRKKFGFSGYDRWCLVGWLVVTGWVVHLVGKANGRLEEHLGFAINESTWAWIWLGVIIFTFIVLIEDFPKSDLPVQKLPLRPGHRTPPEKKRSQEHVLHLRTGTGAADVRLSGRQAAAGGRQASDTRESC